MKRMMVVMTAVAVVLGVAYAYAHGPGFGRGDGYGQCGDCGNYGTSNPLTQEQWTQLRELRQKFFDETASLRDSIHAKRDELRSLWSDPKADPQMIMAKEKELGTLRDQMRDSAVKEKIEARKILTPEQLSQVSQGGWGRGQGFRGGEGRGYGRGRGFGGGPCY